MLSGKLAERELKATSGDPVRVPGRGRRSVPPVKAPSLYDKPGQRPRMTRQGRGGSGIRPAGWDQLDLVASWRRFLTDPDSYFRYLLSD